MALAVLLPTVGGSAGVQYNVLDPSTPFIGGGIGTGAGGGDGPWPTAPLGTATVTASVPLVDWGAIQSLRSAGASRRVRTWWCPRRRCGRRS